jgi:NADPH2:quinone reductase
MAAVQLGSLLGATVVAVGSDDAKLDVARTLGAARVLNYRDTDLVTAFRDQIGHADLVLDTVGGDLASDAMRLLGWRGRYLTAGFASGTIPQFAANRLLLKEASVLGVRAGEAARRDPGQAAHSIADLLALADSGALRPYICRRFHLTDAASALRTLAERRVVGRVALTMEGLT